MSLLRFGRLTKILRLIAANADHEIERMRYKLIQSKVLDKNTVFQPLHAQVAQFSAATYDALKPLILEPRYTHATSLYRRRDN